MQVLPPADDSERMTAAIAYIPGVAPLLWLFGQLKQGTFVRYHTLHAVLIGPVALVALVAAGLIAAGLSLAHYGWGLLFGLFLFLGWLGVIALHTWCAVLAYRGQYVVLPVVTPLYYRLWK